MLYSSQKQLPRKRNTRLVILRYCILHQNIYRASTYTKVTESPVLKGGSPFLVDGLLEVKPLATLFVMSLQPPKINL